MGGQIAVGSISNGYKVHEREAAERSWCPPAGGPEAGATESYQTLPSHGRGATQKMLLGESKTLGVVGNAVVFLWLVAVSCPVLFP